MEKQRIVKWSRFLKWVFFAAALALPIVDAGFWITNGYPFLEQVSSYSFIPEIPHMKPLADLSQITKLSGFFVSLLPSALSVAALLFLAKLFAFFEKFEFFTKHTVSLFKTIGGCILLNQIFYPLYVAIFSLVMTMGNAPGERVIQVAFGSQQVALFVIGLSILLVSRVMDEGRKLQEENACTI